MTLKFWIPITGVLLGAGLASLALIFVFMAKFRQSIAGLIKNPGSLETLTLFHKVTWKD